MYVHVLIKNYGQQQYCMPTKLAKRNIAVKTKELVSRVDWLYNYVYKHLLLQIFKAAFNLMFLYTASTTASAETTGTTESVSSAATTETVASSTVGETTQTAETTSEGK